MRDPEKLGRAILALREAGAGVPLARLVDTHRSSLRSVPAYTDGGVISSDPARHHSKTPQNIDLWDGGE